jgi:hypothetical protein
MEPHLNLGKTGAKRQSWRPTSPRALVLRLIRRYPRESRDELMERYVAQASKSAELVEAGLQYHFTNMFQAATRNGRTKPSREQVAALEARVIAQTRAVVARQAADYLMTSVMPNGKELGACTGAEVTVFGGWMRGIAAKINATDTVRSKLTEGDLRAILFGEET